jgi:hypothetical protein
VNLARQPAVIGALGRAGEGSVGKVAVHSSDIRAYAARERIQCEEGRSLI